jgi:hypothetical protein
MNLLGGEELGGLAAAVSLVLDDRAGLPRRPLGEVDYLGRALARPTRAGSMPASARLSVCTGFFFAAMIPLNDGYRGSLIFSTTLTTAGSLARDLVVPVVGLAVDRDRLVPSISTFEANESCGTPRRSASIAASTPIRASVDSDPRTTRSNPILPSTAAIASEVCEHIRPGERVVDQVHRLVGAHRQGLADRFGRLLRAHGQHGDLAAVGLLDLQGLLDGVLIQLVDQAIHRLTIQRGVTLLQLAFGPRIGHLLDADDDVHAHRRTRLWDASIV